MNLAALYGGIWALLIPMGLIVLWIVGSMVFPVRRRVTRERRYSARKEKAVVVSLDECENKISE